MGRVGSGAPKRRTAEGVRVRPGAAAVGADEYADEYEVLVDATLGALLRCTSRLGGEDVDALEVEEI